MPMIRFACPTCKKKLAMRKWQAGRIRSCPYCEDRIRVPTESTHEPTPSAANESEPGEEFEKPLPEEDGESKRPPRRRIKKKRPSRPWALPAWLDPVIAGAAVTGVLGLCLVGGGLIAREFAVLAAALGLMLSMAGGIWLLMVAFREDATAGFLCLIVPLYFVYYAVSHFDDCKRPLCLWAVGSILVVIGSSVGGLSMEPGGGGGGGFRRRVEVEIRKAQPAAPGDIV